MPEVLIERAFVADSGSCEIRVSVVKSDSGRLFAAHVVARQVYAPGRGHWERPTAEELRRRVDYTLLVCPGKRLHRSGRITRHTDGPSTEWRASYVLTPEEPQVGSRVKFDLWDIRGSHAVEGAVTRLVYSKRTGLFSAVHVDLRSLGYGTVVVPVEKFEVVSC